MKEPLDHENEHRPRQRKDQDFLRWAAEEFIAYHGLDDDEADFSEDNEAGFAQDAATDHQEQHEHGDSAAAQDAATDHQEQHEHGDSAAAQDAATDHQEQHEHGDSAAAQDAATDHQEQHEHGDSAGAQYAAAKFPEFRRRGRGLIDGKPWKPPYQRGRFMPVFKRLNPDQPDADPGYDDWIPYHEEEPPMP